MKRRRPAVELFGMSFLDIITCGFGAIVLLLLITKPAIEDGGGEAALKEIERQVSEMQARVSRLRARIVSVPPAELPKGNIRAAEERLRKLKADNAGLERILESRQRTVVEAPRRPIRKKGPHVSGIPVDSEYVIFILDTSGSMKSNWTQVLDVVGRVLDIHPKVSGFQVLSDNGDYLVRAYRKKWIRDTPRLRKVILEAMRRWNVFSNSSPVEGLETALRGYAGRQDGISIYIFGDEYTGKSYDVVLQTLQRLNKARAGSGRKVRVHAIGFLSGNPVTTTRYARLMREVTMRNRGTFLALPASLAIRRRPR